MVALAHQHLEICIFSAEGAHLVLQIAQTVCDVDERRVFAVLGEVARRKQIYGRFVLPCVFDERFDVCRTHGAAFDDEFGVARRGVIKITVFVIRRVSRVAVLGGVIVDVAHLTES